MSLADLLVLLGFIVAVLALVGSFGGDRWGAYTGKGVALAVALVSLGVLLGAHGFIKT